MKKILAAVFAFAASITASHAAVIDFVAEAAATPGGIANGWSKNFGGIVVTVNANVGNPYLDPLLSGRPGGLGACTLRKGPGSGCIAASADNVQAGEAVTLDFGTKVNLSGFSFTNANHNSLNASNNTLIVNGVQWTFAALVATGVTGVKTLTLAFGGSKAAEFYLNSVKAVVPVPAAAPLLISGLAGLGFAARRRRKA